MHISKNGYEPYLKVHFQTNILTACVYRSKMQVITYSDDQKHKSKILCYCNKFEDDVPIDPITLERIPFQHIELASDGIGYNKGTLYEYI